MDELDVDVGADVEVIARTDHMNLVLFSPLDGSVLLFNDTLLD